MDFVTYIVALFRILRVSPARLTNYLLRKGASENFELDEEQLKPFKNFFDKICSLLVIVLPSLNVPNSIDTDSLAYLIDCPMLQRQEHENRKSIGYWSTSLRDAERNYYDTERECVAMVRALQTLGSYLQYEKRTVFTIITRLVGFST